MPANNSPSLHLDIVDELLMSMCSLLYWNRPQGSVTIHKYFICLGNSFSYLGWFDVAHLTFCPNKRDILSLEMNSLWLLVFIHHLNYGKNLIRRGHSRHLPWEYYFVSKFHNNAEYRAFRVERSDTKTSGITKIFENNSHKSFSVVTVKTPALDFSSITTPITGEDNANRSRGMHLPLQATAQPDQHTMNKASQQ